MIYIFGANICKFCKKQVKYLENTFGPDSDAWEYINVAGNNEAIKVAQNLNIENIPAIVVLDDEDNMLIKKEGTLPPDVIFNKIHKNNNILPFSQEELKNKKISQKILSYDPFLKTGDKVSVRTYNNDHICDMIVKKSIKYEVCSRNFSPKELNLYSKSGGRKDLAWKVTLETE